MLNVATTGAAWGGAEQPAGCHRAFGRLHTQDPVRQQRYPEHQGREGRSQQALVDDVQRHGASRVDDERHVDHHVQEEEAGS